MNMGTKKIATRNGFGDEIVALGKENKDILASTDVVFEMMTRRHLVADTDAGKEMIARMNDLRALLNVYKEGVLQTGNGR